MRMPATRFEDLVVWQRAHGFVLAVYRLSRTFPRSETFGLLSQKGYPLNSGMPLRRSLWGGPPGPRRTPSSAHEQAGQGAGCRRGRPPHRGSLVGGYLSQVDSPLQ